MSALAIFSLVGSLLGGPPPAPTAARRPPTLLSTLDARVKSGRLSAREAIYLRAAAIRNPRQLPADLRALPAPRGPSGTRFLVEAFQLVMRDGAQGSPLHVLLQPPPDETHTLDSTRFPLRISYPDAEQAEYAATLLGEAEHSWQQQIDVWGFHPPPMEPGFEPYRIYIGPTGQGVAGYTAPYEHVPVSDRAACYTYIFINPNLGPDSGRNTMAHEFNHALQAAMDCAEVTPFWENTATYIEGKTVPEFEHWNWVMIPSFQALPWRSLDYFLGGSGYQYGGALWLYYLTDRLAPQDGPVFVRRVWEESMQAGWSNNEPDYYDAIEVVAAEYGLAATRMEDLYADFAEARFFCSDLDDGSHISIAGDFPRSEPAMARRHSGLDLPIQEAVVEMARWPAPFGSNHVLLELPLAYSRPLRLTFDGDDQTRWAVRGVLYGNDRPTVSVPLEIDELTGNGVAVVAPAGHAGLVLVVANLSPEGYEPDDRSWPLAGYRYSIEPVIDPPVITGLHPAAVLRGQQNLRMRLTGSGFDYGPEFAIVFTDPELQIVSIDALTETEVHFTLTVPGGVRLGPSDVRVINRGGAQSAAPELLWVLDRLGDPNAGGGAGKPGDCSTGGSGGPAGLGLALLLLMGRWSRRRRRR